jgi:hypothetical protein
MTGRLMKTRQLMALWGVVIALLLTALPAGADLNINHPEVMQIAETGNIELALVAFGQFIA